MPSKVLSTLSSPRHPMRPSRNDLRSPLARLRSWALLTLLAWACSSPSTDAPITAPSEVLGAKAEAPGVGASSTSPAYGDRGTTMNVRVFGSGFAADAQATWLLHGVADPARVRTNSTSYVSSTELVANITISSEADLTFWDVAVQAGGKNGVGTEVFEVSTAEFLGTGNTVVGINDGGQIAGTSAAGVFVYDPSFGMKTVASGQAWGLDPLGQAVVGRYGQFATAWMRQGTTSSYVAEALPPAPTATGGNAAAAVRDATGTLVVGGWQTLPVGRRESVNRPAIWRRTDSWSAPTLLPLPAGTTTGSIWAMNALGQAAGRIEGQTAGAVWDDASTVTALDGLPSGINATGTIVVGSRAEFPVYWYRTATGSWNATAVTLPSLGTSRSCVGEAAEVSADGVIVGKSCDSNGKAQATVWRLDLTGPTPVLVSGPQRLPGLGVKSSTSNDASGAAAITNTAPYVIAGFTANPGSGGAYAIVRWPTF